MAEVTRATGGRPPGRSTSLRGRLLRLVTLATVLVWVLAAVLSYHQAQREMRELMDAQMDNTARLLLAQAQFNERHLSGLLDNMAALRGAKRLHDELPIEFQIAHADGTTLVRSKGAPEISVTETLGFADRVYGGQTWRSLSLSTEDGNYRVQVLQSIRLRDKEVLELAVQAVLPLGVLFPLLLSLIYLSVRRGLKPLDELADDMATRSLDNLEALTGHAVPREAQPMVAALNDLLSRLAATLEYERRFTADAAHELRTPLAAVKVQAQVALISTDSADQRHALKQVLAGAERATHLVEQLLRMARLDPLASLPDPQTVDLADLAQMVVAEVQETNAKNAAAFDAAGRIDLEIGEGAAACVRADRDLLSIALRNLLDNALRYTPAGSRVTVSVHHDAGECSLVVSDEGEGVAANELPRLTERFYRGSEVRAVGTGLGLAIVQRIAELHGARLEIANRQGGGLVARLRWPGASPAADTT